MDITFEQEVELAKQTFAKVRPTDDGFSQMFAITAYDGELTVGTMDEPTADRRADVLTALVYMVQAKQLVFVSDTWYRVIPKDAPRDNIMPADDPDRKEALAITRFRPGSVEVATIAYEVVGGEVIFGDELGDNFTSNTFPRVREALAKVRLGMKP
jgi:hypothetical protein